MNSSKVFGLLITVMAFFTFVWNYTNPPYLYWDENYHIASAQKYLTGTFFMEPHPPLGKLLIAAGEKLVNANDGADDEFVGTDYARELPANFSFKGYRLFPVLFGWLIAPLLYFIFLCVTRKPLWAFFLSFLYVFDNALITHSRAAMLDSTMLFFCTAMIAVYFLLLKTKNDPNRFAGWSLLFGIAFACAMSTKALALIMILLVPAVIVQLQRKATKISGFQDFRISGLDAHRIVQFLSLSATGFLMTYVGIWHLHFAIGKTIVPSLPDNGYYQTSDEYKSLLNAGKINTPLMIRENLQFLTHYSSGVPKLNLCKDDENGSPFFFWPLGARSINYRWETPDGNTYQYITLQVNPVVWGIAFIGLILAFVLIVGSWMNPAMRPNGTHVRELTLWFGIWAAYMIAVSRIDRVMYLYHYFIPLLISFIVTAYVFLELSQIRTWKLTDARKNWILLILGFLIFLGFQFYRPLTYYEPIDDAAFRKRMIFRLWDLRCVHCDTESLLAIPLDANGRSL